MTDREKLDLLVPAVRALLEAAHKLGISPVELVVQTNAAWVGEILGDGAHGIERTSIVDGVSLEDRMDHAENAAKDYDRQAIEAALEDEEAVMCWECPKCGDVIPYTTQRPEDHRCTKNKDTNASIIAIPAGHH